MPKGATIKAWILDALLAGLPIGVVTGVVLGDGLGESIFNGALTGGVLASAAAWRKWPSPGRRRFAESLY
jgi:hypothetical protein